MLWTQVKPMDRGLQTQETSHLLLVLQEIQQDGVPGQMLYSW